MPFQYADPETLIADLIPGLVGNEEAVDTIGRVVEGVSSFIDRFTRREIGAKDRGYFSPVEAEAEPTLRFYEGEGERFLRIPPHVGTASIDNINEALYYEDTENGWLYAQPYPSETIPIDSNYISRAGFARGTLYPVYAVWGFEETPPAIVEATRQTTLRVWETQRGIFGALTPNGVVIERALPPFVEEILLSFRRKQFER